MFFAFFVNYLLWHYTTALFLYLRVLRNMSWFITNLLSLGPVFDTLAFYLTNKPSPLASKPALILEILVGIVLKTIYLLAGLVLWCLVIIIGIFGYTIWLLLPVIILAFILIGALMVFEVFFSNNLPLL